MKTENLVLLLLASVLHAFLFYGFGTPERACLSLPDCDYDKTFCVAREEESDE